jgi:dipeptidyl aminopeptidase/acylaminoacyl peptidase
MLWSRPSRVAVVFALAAGLLLWLLPSRPSRRVEAEREWPTVENSELVRAAVTSDGEWAACSSKERSPDLDVVETKTGRVAKRLSETGRVSFSPLAFSPDGGYLAVWASRLAPRDSDGLEVWCCRTWERRLRVPREGEAVPAFCFSPDGRRLAATSDWQWRQVAVWDVERGEILGRTDLPGQVEHLDWSEDGTRIVAALQDGTGQVWDAASGRPVARLESEWAGRNLVSCAFADGGRRVVGYYDETGQLVVWDAASGLKLAEYDFRGVYLNVVREREGQLLLIRRKAVDWMASVVEKRRWWLPARAEAWLREGAVREEVYTFDAGSGAFRLCLTLPAGSLPLARLPTAREVISYRVDEEKRHLLEWWPLEPPRAWGPALTWASVVAGVYWVSSLWRAWRRKAPAAS